MPIRILVADDQPLIADGLRWAIADTDLEIVGQVDSCDQLIRALQSLRPQVLVTEIRLGQIDVIRELEAYATEGGGCAILFFSMHDSPMHIARAGSLGCHDYLGKNSATQDLLAAIRRAAAGEPTPASSQLSKTRAKIRTTTNWAEVDTPLTQREKQVLQHLAMGMSNREIGRSLSISSATVKEYVQKIMRKLDANDRTQAAVWAVREGLI